MNRLPQLFQLQSALAVLSQQTDVLPAVGGAMEDELRPDTDERSDEEATKEDGIYDEPFEIGQTNTHVPLDPLKREQEHLFRWFQDGAMRSFFIGTCLEHERQTPVILGQVGCVSLRHLDDGRLTLGHTDFRNLLMVGFQQLNDPLRQDLERTIAPLGDRYRIADIESKGREGQDLRARSADRMRSEMTKAEMKVLTSVVGIYNLKDEEKALVFGDILRTIYNLYAESDVAEKDLPKKVIIFVDELNKDAPEGSKGSPIVEPVLEIAERGPSLGIVLFDAQQFLSAVHDRVTGNCSTTLLGRTNAAEMAERNYRFLKSDIKVAATRLDKGQLIPSHAVFREPVKIKFPMAAYKQPS